MQRLLFYQTHGRFVRFGSLIFNLTMTSTAQKTRAAEVTLHSVYSLPTWIHLCTVHRKQISESRDPAKRSANSASISRQHLIAVL